MGTHLVTGAASGIGAATCALLSSQGHTVVGADRHDADIVADLATAEGRARLVELAPAELDGVVACAGVLGGRDNAATVTAVNLFGALATLDGLRPRLRPGSGAVALGSVAATVSPLLSADVLAACLAEDEPAALAAATDGMSAYAASKLALAQRVRARAVSPEWVGAGLRLNLVTPGLVDTPMTAAHLGVWLGAGDAHPIPLGRAATPTELAEAVVWLLGATFCVGTVLVVDGGTEAVKRAGHWPLGLPG